MLDKAYTYQTEKQKKVNYLYKNFYEVLKVECPEFNFSYINGTSGKTGKKYEWDLTKESPHIRYYDYPKVKRWGLAWALYADDDSGETFGTSIDVKTEYPATEFVELYLNGLQKMFNATHLEIHNGG